MKQNKKEKLEAKIIELENRKAELEDHACYILADILERKIEELRESFYNC